MEYPEELYDHTSPEYKAGKIYPYDPNQVHCQRPNSSSEMWEPKQEQDMVNHPPHYTSGGIETIDYMEAKSTAEEFRGHLRLTAIKYLSRAGLKDDTLQDYEKAAWYLNKLIEHVKTKV
jgi:hypothetical protein